MTELANVLKQIDDGLDASLERLMELLRFPSIGTDPAFHCDCRNTAEWLDRLLKHCGFQTSIEETTGQPLVVATWNAAAPHRHGPHILFYGHYDVQPVDPLNKWTTPPFEPEIRQGASGEKRIFARGSADDKGQFMTFVEAVRAWLTVNPDLPLRITVLLEGDEEGESIHFDDFIKRNKARFKPDIALVCDTEMWGDGSPAIVTSLRGCTSEDVIITGPKIDLHSGYYGGAAVNPIKVLSRIMADMHDARGRVTIPGFYDGVKPPSSKQRKRIDALKFSANKFLKLIGLSKPAGEQAYSLLEQVWYRPTVEFNGIIGGYTGEGAKTVLPSKATGKFSFRIVAGQNPKALRKAFQKFVKDRLPKDCKAEFISGGNANAIHVSDDSLWIKCAVSALQAEWKKPAVIIGSGYSIPAVETMKTYLNVDSLLVGFGREEDSVHSPNESYAVESFHRGMRSWARILNELMERN